MQVSRTWQGSLVENVMTLSIRNVLSASSRSAVLPFTPTFRRPYYCSSIDAFFNSNTMLSLIDRLNSPPAQTLQVLQPTSSTITYTVSTRPVPKTLPALVGYYAGISLRVVLGVSSLLISWLKLRVTQEAQLGSLILWTMEDNVEAQFVRLAEACPWRYLGPSACIILFLVLHRNYTGGFCTPFSFCLLRSG